MNAALLLEHYARISDAPDAIARLRRFVLDLAVHGKLVEQDTGNEPANELLERIKKANPFDGQKRRGRSRDTSAGNPLEDIPFEAPKGWTFASLGELVRVLNGRAYKQQELLDQGTPVLRVGNLFTSNRWYYSDLILDDDKHCDAGDLIFAWSASFGPFIWNGPRVIYHYHIWKLPLVSEADLDKQYLYNFLLQKTREIKEAGHGISMVHMTKEKMEKLIVPLPPLAEQHRIVARINELMSLCDQLEAARGDREAARDKFTLSTLSKLNTPDPSTFGQDARFVLANIAPLTIRPDQIKQLRQTILNLAVRGKLVEQDAADEPALKLFQRLQSEKARLAKAGIIPRPKQSARDLDFLAEGLPASWLPIALGDVCNLVTSGSRGWGEYYADSGPGFIRAQNIRFGKLRLGGLACVNPPAKSEGARTQVAKGDLLIVITGAGVTNPALLQVDLGEAYVSQHVGLVRPCDTELSPWLLLCLMADAGGRTELTMRAYGAGKPGLNLDNIRSLSVPLPPLAEQHRIVAKVDALIALCGELEATLAEGDETRSKLLEAVLTQSLEPA